MNSAHDLLLGLRLLLVMLPAIVVTGANAQSTHPAFFHYSTDDGLPSSECYELLQDRQGYVWVSGDNGISRFDGHEFKNYGTEEGLIDKTVLLMQEDHRGWIWLSTFSGNFYILRGDTIVPYAHNNLIQELRNQFYAVTVFHVDTLGNLVAGMHPYAVIMLSPAGELTYPGTALGVAYGIFDPGGQPFIHSRTLRDGKHSLATELLFQHFDKQRIITSSAVSEWPISKTTLLDNLESKLHCWRFGELYIWQILDRLYYWLPGEDVTSSEFHDVTINQLVTTRSGGFLVADNERKGVHYFENLEALKNDRAEFHFLENFTISHVLEDRDGGLWYATTENGIYYSPAPDVDGLLLDEVARTDRFLKHFAVLDDNTGVIFNQHQEFLRIRDSGERGEWRQYPTPGALSFSEYFPKNDLFLVGSMVYYSDSNLSTWKPVLNVESDNRLYTKYISIPDNEEEDLWYAAYYLNHATIGKMRIGDRQVEYAENYILPDQKRIHAVAKVEDRLALGNRDGVHFYHPETEEFTESPALSVLSSRIDDLRYTADRKLLVATRGQGFGVYDLLQDTLRLFGTEQLMVSNSISKIVEDQYGVIWTGSQNGVNRIVLNDSVRIRSYTIADGLPSNDVLDLDEWGDYMAVTTGKGIALLPLHPTENPPLEISLDYQVFLNNRLLDFEQGMKFSYRENSLRFVFYYLNYRYRGNFNYRYRLHPEDEWTITDNREIILSSLPPGDYQLEVEVSALGLDFEQRRQFSFSITPPFWQRTSVIILAGLIVTFVTYALISGYVDRLRREGEKIKLDEEINTLRQQAYRAQMNPHFIFNCLHTIQGMIIGDDTEQEAAVRMVARFSRLIRSALDASTEETVSLEEEIRLLENYLDLERIRFNQRFEYAIEIDPALERDWVRIPPMLVQPFVENAVLHGMEHKRGDGMITVSYTLRENRLYVKIFDNGPGISYTKQLKAQHPSKHEHQSRGMTITKKRLAILNENGYEISINEPQGEDGRILGTEIILQIPIH